MSLKNIVLAAFGLIACGSSSTNNDPDGGLDCKYCDVDDRKDMGYNDSKSDGSADSNNPLMIQFDPEMSRNIRVGSPKTLTAIVNGSADCKWDFGDGTPETNYGSCETSHYHPFYH